MSNVIALPNAAVGLTPAGSVLRLVLRPALGAAVVAGVMAAASTVVVTELFGISLGTAPPEISPPRSER